MFAENFKEWVKALIKLNPSNDHVILFDNNVQARIDDNSLSEHEKTIAFNNFLTTLINSDSANSIDYPLGNLGNKVTAGMQIEHFKINISRGNYNRPNPAINMAVISSDDKHDLVRDDSPDRSNDEQSIPPKETSKIDRMMGFAMKHPELVAGIVGFTVCLGLAALAALTMGLGLIPGLGVIAAAGATVGLSSAVSCAAGVVLTGVAGGVAGVVAVKGKKFAKSVASGLSFFDSKDKVNKSQPTIPLPRSNEDVYMGF